MEILPQMRSTLVAVVALLAAAALGAFGFAIGTNAGGDRASAETIVKDALAASQPAPPATSVAPSADAALLTEAQQHEIEGIIRNYLIANPEVIRDAIEALQRKEDAAAQMAQTQAIQDNRQLIFSSTKQAVLGNPNGDVTLVEFFDYNCPYCRRANADLNKLIKDDPNLRVVLKEFPILSDASVQAAQIAAAVLLVAPDKYGAFHETLINDKGSVDGAKALAVAQDLGLDTDALKVKANSDEAKAIITEAHDLAGKLDLTGTPSYVTPDQVVVGAVGYDQLKAAIAQARAACADKKVPC